MWQCAYAFRDDVEQMDDTSNDAGVSGTKFHTLATAHIDGVTDDPLAGDDSDTAKRARAIYVRWLPWWQSFSAGLTWRSEVPFALSLTTGEARILKSHGQRDYSDARPGEIVGTADAIAVDGETIHIGDFKTGRPEYVEPATHNKQLRTLGLAAARIYNATRIRPFLVFASDDAEPYADEGKLDILDLDFFEDDLRARIASIPNSKPTPGNACRFCRSRHVCPAVTAATRDVANDTASSALAIVAKGGALTPDVIGHAYDQIGLVEEAVKLVKDRIRAEVERAGTIPLADGRKLKLIDVARETLSAASIKRALPKEQSDLVLAQLREAGAIESGSSKQLRAVGKAAR